MTLEAMEACNFPLPQVGHDGEMSCPEGFTATQPSPPAEAGDHISNPPPLGTPGPQATCIPVPLIPFLSA